MLREGAAHLAVGIELVANEVFAGASAQVRRGRRHEPLDVVFVGVNQEPHEGLLVVRFVGNVGQHQDALSGGLSRERAEVDQPNGESGEQGEAESVFHL